MKAQRSSTSSPLVLLAFQIIIFHEDVKFASTADMGGMYELAIQRVVECEGVESPKLTFDTEIINPEDGNKYLMGNFTFDFDMAPDETMDVNVFKWGQNAGYQKNAYHLEKPSPCTALKTDFPNIFKNLFEGMGITDCPMTKGSYELKRMDLEGWTLKNMANLPFGKYYLLVQFKKGDETLGCLQIYVDVNQKAKQSPGIM